MLVHLAPESLEEERSTRNTGMAQERLWSRNGRHQQAFHRLAQRFHPNIKTVRHSSTILARILAQPFACRTGVQYGSGAPVFPAPDAQSQWHSGSPAAALLSWSCLLYTCISLAQFLYSIRCFHFLRMLAS